MELLYAEDIVSAYVFIIIDFFYFVKGKAPVLVGYRGFAVIQRIRDEGDLAVRSARQYYEKIKLFCASNH